MGFFYRVSSVLLLNLILVHARPENLFSSDSIQPTLDAPLDDASPLWSSDEFSSGSTTNPLDQDASFMSDIDSFDNSNNLFASNSIDLTALPSCESEGSLTDGVLQARDGASCLPKDTPKDIINLPIELFQDPEAYLRNNLGTPPTDQKNQPGQGNMQDEDMKSVVTTSDFQQDEESCPTEIFGPSNIPVCRNPFTGRMVSEVSSYAVTLYNVIPCRCFSSHFAAFRGNLSRLLTFLARRYPCMP